MTGRWPMTRRRLLRQMDRARVERAIAEAEGQTSAELRVSIAGFFRGDAQALAERAFARLGMMATRHRNGVLILVAPTRRKVVVLPDRGLAATVDAGLWPEVASALAERFKEGDFTDGLVAAIARLGRALAVPFPPDRGGQFNELADAVDLGGPRAGRPR